MAQEQTYLGIDLPEYVLAYAAGLLDGEGHIGIHRTKTGFYLRVDIANTNERIIQFLYEYFGGILSQRQRGINWKIVYEWNLYKQEDVSNFLHLVEPYAIAKKPQIELAIFFISFAVRYQHSVGIKEKAILFEQMKVLNKRGV